jgi:cytochrome c oxidase cbb3-type subunit 3
MRKAAIFILLALGSVIPLRAQRQNASFPQPGKQLFETHCAACHGLNGTGGEAPAIATEASVRAMSDQQLGHTIHDGLSGGMPAFKTLSQGDITAIVNYLRYLQGGQRTAVQGNAAAGKTLFFGNAGCSECHMVHGKGGFIGPDLTGLPLSPSEIQDAIVKPQATPSDVLTTVTLRNGRTITGLVRNEDNFSIQMENQQGQFYLLNKANIKSISRAATPFMPSDYAKRLSPTELQNIVAYVASVAAPAGSRRRGGF